jgi:hypothetical protein
MRSPCDSRWHQLIDLRQPVHPRDVIEPWQRLIQRRLDASTDKYRYGKAIKMLQRLRDAYQATGDAAGFGTYLDHLRDRHKRKTSFIAKLDHATCDPLVGGQIVVSGLIRRSRGRLSGATGLAGPLLPFLDTGTAEA